MNSCNQFDAPRWGTQVFTEKELTKFWQLLCIYISVEIEVCNIYLISVIHIFISLWIDPGISSGTMHMY